MAGRPACYQRLVTDLGRTWFWARCQEMVHNGSEFRD